MYGARLGHIKSAGSGSKAIRPHLYPKRTSPRKKIRPRWLSDAVGDRRRGSFDVFSAGNAETEGRACHKSDPFMIAARAIKINPFVP